jgi:hypothetical protein
MSKTIEAMLQGEWEHVRLRLLNTLYAAVVRHAKRLVVDLTDMPCGPSGLIRLAWSP